LREILKYTVLTLSSKIQKPFQKCQPIFPPLSHTFCYVLKVVHVLETRSLVSSVERWWLFKRQRIVQGD
jgi:hypothetical protein